MFFSIETARKSALFSLNASGALLRERRERRRAVRRRAVRRVPRDGRDAEHGPTRSSPLGRAERPGHGKERRSEAKGLSEFIEG